MAKKAPKTTAFSSDTSSGGASAAPKKAAASRTQKHLKAQASGVVAAVEGFVSAITNTVSDSHAVAEAPAVSASAVIAHVAAPEMESPVTARPVSTPTPVTQEEIAVLAYCYYLDRRPEDGTQADDWFRAEQALNSR